MTLSEFSARNHLTPETVEALFRKIGVPPGTPIDEELEGILLNLSDTRVPVYPPNRRSAVSPSELEILLKHYELHVEADVFLDEGFYVFGKMLFGLLQKTEKTIAIPADMVVELKKRIAAEPDNQSLGALKTLLVHLARSGRGVASPIKTTPELTFAETVFRSCPGKNLAILAKDAALPQALIQEAQRNHQHLAFFYLDNGGFMRVNPEIAFPQTAPMQKQPTLHVQTPPPAPTDAPTMPLSPAMTGAGTVQKEGVPAPPRGSSSAFAPSSALLHKTPQALESASEMAPASKQNHAPSAVHPIGVSGETAPPPVQQYRPARPSIDVYPAYPAQDVTQLTPGAVPHPFPGPDTLPSKPPMRMEPFSKSPPVHPVPPFSSSRVQNTGPSIAPLPKQETLPVSEPAAAENALPGSPADHTIPPSITASPKSPQVAVQPIDNPPLPPGLSRDAQGRLVKRGRLHKASSGVPRGDSPAAPQPLAPNKNNPTPPVQRRKAGQPVLIDDSDRSPTPSMSQNAQRQPTMKERFVQGLDEGMPPLADEDGPDNPVRKLSATLKALYATLALLGLGIAGLIIYQILF